MRDRIYGLRASAVGSILPPVSHVCRVLPVGALLTLTGVRIGPCLSGFMGCEAIPSDLVAPGVLAAACAWKHSNVYNNVPQYIITHQWLIGDYMPIGFTL